MVFLIVVLIIAVSFAGLGTGIWIRGKFPETHVENNPDMKKLGITCAKNDTFLCDEKKRDTACGTSCEGCVLFRREREDK
ncbi:MAG: hypothetical protein LBR08_03965 [Bacteroidales bacterium]|jgi:hypothetical protein|nr:hypothetical protein [Bacteroidales bacterium]